MNTMNAGGFDTAIGLTVTEVKPDRVVGEWLARPSLHQAAGLLHGGVYCAVVESLASTGAWAWLRSRGDSAGVVGVNNSTDFLRPVSGGTLRAEATPVHRGRTQQLWQVVVTDDRGRTVARGQVRLQNLPPTGSGQPTTEPRDI